MLEEEKKTDVKCRLLVQIYNLDMLSERLKGVYKSVTEGKFSEALRLVNVILHIIPLTVVDGRREVDELKELLSIARSASLPTPPTAICASAPDVQECLLDLPYKSKTNFSSLGNLASRSPDIIYQQPRRRNRIRPL